MEVFFFEAFAEEADCLSQYLPQGINAGFTELTIQEHGVKAPPAPVICIRTQSRIPVTWAKRINGILTRSTGYDHILRYREASGVEVKAGNLPSYCSRSVAEHAMLLWMALLRRLPTQVHQFHTFNRNNLTGRETYEKKLAIFGVGNIGYEIAGIARGLGMKIMGVDIDQKHSDIEYLPPKEAMAQADIAVSAMNLTGENAGYFSEELFNEAQPGLIFVNISRGELAPAPVLLKLLESNQLGGVGLDVFNEEENLGPALRGSSFHPTEELEAIQRLTRRLNVILTPHNAFNTEEGVERKCHQTVISLLQFHKEGTFPWPI